jgi:hypothetical protein
MTIGEQLTHALKVRFRLPPDRPSHHELLAIVGEAIDTEARLRRPLSDDEWKDITYRHVPFEGKYIYEGLNFQNLNALLAVVRAQVRGKG